jgi:hypothetical protein
MTLDFGLFAVIMRDFAGLGWQRVSDPWESKRFILQVCSARGGCPVFAFIFSKTLIYHS